MLTPRVYNVYAYRTTDRAFNEAAQAGDDCAITYRGRQVQTGVRFLPTVLHRGFMLLPSAVQENVTRIRLRSLEVDRRGEDRTGGEEKMDEGGEEKEARAGTRS